MKILAVSDRVVNPIYGSHIRKRFGDVDMVVSCGDLPYSYLEYIVSMLNVPSFYVHGNHDGPEYLSDGRTLTEPRGWVNLDGRTVRCKGLLLGGLAGMVSLGAFLVGIQSRLPADQPFRFDPAGSPTSLGDPIRLVILPLAGGFVWLLNAVIGWWAWRKGLRPTAYIFWTVSLLVAIGLWASSASLILAK